MCLHVHLVTLVIMLVKLKQCYISAQTIARVHKMLIHGPTLKLLQNAWNVLDLAKDKLNHNRVIPNYDISILRYMIAAPKMFMC